MARCYRLLVAILFAMALYSVGQAKAAKGVMEECPELSGSYCPIGTYCSCSGGMPGFPNCTCKRDDKASRRTKKAK